MFMTTHSSAVCSQLYADAHYQLLERTPTRACKRNKRLNSTGPGGFYKLVLRPVHAGRESITDFTRHGGLIGVRLSLAGLFWGSRRRGFVAAVLPGAWFGPDLQGHVPGILPEQLGGGQNSHSAAACTSGV